jgi:hypothetical protein
VFVTIRRYKTGSPGEITKVVDKEFTRIINKVPGFVAYYCVESGADEWSSISIFKNEKQAEKSNRLAADWVIEKNLGPLITAGPDVTAGKIVVKKKA